MWDLRELYSIDLWLFYVLIFFIYIRESWDARDFEVGSKIPKYLLKRQRICFYFCLQTVYSFKWQKNKVRKDDVMLLSWSKWRWNWPERVLTFPNAPWRLILMNYRVSLIVVAHTASTELLISVLKTNSTTSDDPKLISTTWNIIEKTSASDRDSEHDSRSVLWSKYLQLLNMMRDLGEGTNYGINIYICLSICFNDSWFLE